MTAATDPGHTSQAQSTTRRYRRRRSSFGGHVAATIEPIQRAYRRGDSAALAIMAQLRAAAAAIPGQHYTVLGPTLVPQEYLEPNAGDDPSDTEHAKHTAVTLYAIHQQSIRDRSMHVDGPSFGASVGLLSKASPNSDAVRRRFVALGTATTYQETIHHLRSLVRLLREHRICLDYGLLAEDLVRLRRPGGRTRVQALWGRDFYRASSEGTADELAPATEE